MTSEIKWMEAFSYMVGTITIREELNMPPLPAKELLQQVYDSYGVLPIDSIVKKLGMRTNEKLGPTDELAEPYNPE